MIGLSLAVAGVALLVGVALVFLGAPIANHEEFDLTNARPTGWLNLSQPFWGTGSLTISQAGFGGGPNSTLLVARCLNHACLPANRSTVYSGGPLFFTDYTRGLPFGDYIVVGTNLTYPLAINLTFDFNWSLEPWVASLTETQSIGLILSLCPGGYLIWFGVRIAKH